MLGRPSSLWAIVAMACSAASGLAAAAAWILGETFWLGGAAAALAAGVWTLLASQRHLRLESEEDLVSWAERRLADVPRLEAQEVA